MKFLSQKLLYFIEKIKSNGFSGKSTFQQQRLLQVTARLRLFEISSAIRAFLQQSLNQLKALGIGITDAIGSVKQVFIDLHWKIKSIGFTDSLDELEKRKLGIFNQLNFFGFVAGIVAPLAGIFDHTNLPSLAWIVACSPAFISLLVFWLNYKKKYEISMISYFILYPVFTSLVYVGGINLGIQLFFILYGILSVFFIPRLSQMLFSIAFSMISYFMLAVVLKNYQYQLEAANYSFYLVNQGLAIVFIFYGLFIIKQENTGYQFNILGKNRELHRINLEIQKQKAEIAEKAALLEEQTLQLAELNSLKNKLFSVISHDLKTPMYALRNLFQTVQEHDFSAEDIKALVPDVVNELNYTTGLMENLLHWAKSQMQSGSIHAEKLDLTHLIQEVSRLLNLQARTKKIKIECKLNKKPVFAYADKDMVNLVLRNLLSNAIKFTPVKGNIVIRVEQRNGTVEVFVKDSGIGISKENMSKLFNEYFTSKGTSEESGTGLGLILCKEFLSKNGGEIYIQSKEGKGSEFSFTIPSAK